MIKPSGDSWMAGEVFDARPIWHKGRQLILFCAQPHYRSDMHLLVGKAELDGDECIDIPAFTVVNDVILGMYADYGGPVVDRDEVGLDMILVRSQDGENFSKTVIPAPFAGQDFQRLGLPWLLALNGREINVYFRAKRGGKAYLARSVFNLEEGCFGSISTLFEFPRSPINIAVTRRKSVWLLIYGATVGGGFYAIPANDDESWGARQERMLVHPDSAWGWDFYKVCPSPDNRSCDNVTMCYMAGSINDPSVGLATFDAREIPQ